MKKLSGKTVLEHVIERVGQSKYLDQIIVATTTDYKDQAIYEEALRCGAKSFKGSEDDVLERYYLAAKQYGAKHIARVTADCPLIDPWVIDKVISRYRSGEYDLATNAGPNISERTYPRGLDVEVFSFNFLEQANQLATKNYQREHVTPYMYEHNEKVLVCKNATDLSHYRLTLDTEEDLALIEKIYEYLYKGSHDFYLDEILELFKEEPSLYKINAHIEQKKYY